MVLEILKYSSWAITTLIPIAGQFLWKFTEDTTNTPGGYRWTAAGKVALVLTLLGVVISLGMSVASDAQDARDKVALNASNAAIQEKLDIANANVESAAGNLTTMKSELAEMDAELKNLVKNTPTEALGSAQRQQVLVIQNHITQMNSLINAEVNKASKLPKK